MRVRFDQRYVSCECTGPARDHWPSLCRERTDALPISLIRLGNLAVLCTLLGGCGIEDLAAPRVSAPAALPPAELRGVVFEGFSGGIRDAEVRAAEARIDTEERVALLRDVNIGFSDERRGRVEIRADRGTLDLDTEDFLLSGGVEGRTAVGDRFSTAKLEYRSDGRKLWSDTPVRLDRANMQLYAEGMEFDLEDRRVVLTGKVEARLGISDPAETGERR